MRVLHCIPTLEGGGAERQLRLLLPRLARHDVTTGIVARLSDFTLEKMRATAVATFPVQTTSNYDPRMAGHIWQAIRQFGPDIVQTWLPQMDLLAGPIALAQGRRWVISERSSAKAYPCTIKNVARKALGGLATCVIANSASGSAYWPRHRSSFIVPNALDLRAIAAAPSLPQQSTVDFVRRRIILAVGRLSPEKRFDLAIEAVDRLRQTVPDALLVIAGRGPLEQELRDLVAARGLNYHVYFAGFRDDVWSWMKAADIGLSTSAFEGQPNVVLEAAAAGLPQVLSDIREHRDTLPATAAIFCDRNEVTAFATALERLLESSALQADIARTAALVVADQSIDRAAKAYAEIYRGITAL